MQKTYLIIIENNRCETISLQNESYLLGREQVLENSIVLSSPLVSRKHAKIFQTDGVWFYYDNSSSNGTLFRGKKLSSGLCGRHHPVMLRHGDVLQIGADDDPNRVWILFVTQPMRNLTYMSIDGLEQVSIGKAPDNNIVMNNATDYHAVVNTQKSHSKIIDMGSDTGTYINGDRVIRSANLSICDKISICDYRLIYTGCGFLIYEK